ncbi:MAG: geranylgeranylglyceryl/heptaprenylglyceryl phosphate synthase [Candidatus Cloacimonetes bacterium]|nr:geranylgeranylglyceryl/heptaprenylglyceryl phosphate synthase [Candidatus Cloacimonadota bacterium]
MNRNKMKNNVYKQILDMPKPAHFVLIDPDKSGIDEGIDLAVNAEKFGVDAILIGSSIHLNDNLDDFIREIKSKTTIPIIIFPGILNVFSSSADAILFLSMISSRNPQFLIGEQVRAAPIIKKYGLETISTAYLLIESGKMTSVQYMSNSMPIPRNKPDIIIAHVLAAELIGMKAVYLEAGSGADHTVPTEVISRVKEVTSLPLIVGGGIRTPEAAESIAKAGADIVVTGTIFENNRDFNLLAEFCQTIHKQRND